MKRKGVRLILALPLLVLALLTNGCMFRGTRSLFDLVGPRMMSEFYRGEGIVCTVPEPLESSDGIVIGVSFRFAVIGHSCEEQSRKVLVTEGSGLVRRAEVAKKNQIVTIIGIFNGPQQETLVARDIFIQRR
ncbi:MAG: hypothetical protein AAF604_05380 [Acidobacteriota bacterium]